MIVLDDLRALEIFDDVDPTLLAHVAARAADIHVSPGEFVIHEGEVPAFFIILDGQLELTKRFGALERVLGVRDDGAYFGEIPLLLGSPTFAGLRASKASRVARIEIIEFHLLVREAPAFEARVRRTMNERLEGLREFTVELPAEIVTLVGRRVDNACHEVRDFLSRNHIAYDFLEVDEPGLIARFPTLEHKLDRCPIVYLPDGRMMIEPTLRELAFHLNLQTEPRAHEYDVAIVGGGPAGLAAAVYGASEGLSTLMIEREAPGGQAGTSSRIENYLGFPTGVSGDELGSRALAQAKRLGAEILVTRQVTSIFTSEEGHDIVLDGGDVVKTRAIVLATGVRWRMLPIEGIDRFVGAGVYFGAARTEAMNAQGKHVFLIGAGNSAGQAAMFFANYASQVSLVVRGRSLAATMSDYLIKQLASKSNIDVLLQSEVTAVYGSAYLEAIDITDRTTGAVRRAETDAVFVFIGADAATGWMPPEIARDDRGYVLTGFAVKDVTPDRKRDPFLLETSVPGIFAAGDVRANSVKRVASGVGEGSMAIAFVHQYLEETRSAAESKLAGSL
jgi:thioredoxin reductase (NADPH)